MAMIYPSEILNNMIHEVEKAFPLETPVFPTSSIRDLIENPDHPDAANRFWTNAGLMFLLYNGTITPSLWVLLQVVLLPIFSRQS